MTKNNLVEFENRKTGEKLRCEYLTVSAESPDLMREFQLCIRDEYGETYPNRDIYEAEKIEKLIKGGRMIALLAVSEDGDPVSSLALSPCGNLADVPEMSMHVVRKPYRGFRVGSNITNALLEMPAARNFSAVTTHSVTFHPMAQHQTLDCGLIPCGFLFLVHSNLILKHSFDTKGCVKQSFAVGIYPEKKRNAGTLYVPNKHRDFIGEIYGALGAKSTFAEGSDNSGQTEMHTNFDDIHKSLTAEVFHAGSDFECRVKELITRPHHPHTTANFLVDANDPAAVRAYEILRKNGFIFTGMHPLCANGEFMIMHNSMDLEIPFDRLCVDEGYMKVFKYIYDNSGGCV